MALPSSCNSRRWLTALLTVAVVGCAEDPATFPARLHAALNGGDADAVDRLLTPQSRPLWRALRIARGDTGVGIGLSGPPPELRTMTPQGTRMLLTVRAGGVERDWVLVREGDGYLLDLNETSIRRPWNLP